MTSSKHKNSPGEGPFTSDLDADPGIGQSKGTFATGVDLEEVNGVSTTEGDTDNEATVGGGASDTKLGRTNK